MINPVTYELAVLVLLGASGIAVSALVGLRAPVLMAVAGLGFGISLRLLAGLAAIAFGEVGLSRNLWLFLAVSAIIASGIINRWDYKPILQAFSLSIALTALSIAVKYVFRIGEMQHADSSDVIFRSLLVIQGGADDLSPLSEPKRGFLYPLMLALGPDGRILGAFTPQVFFTMALLLIWLSWRATREFGFWPRIIALTSVGAFLLTVPMVRISITYINSHTLVGFASFLMTAAAILTIETKSYSSENAWLFAVSAVIAVTSRIEAILVVAILVASLLRRYRLTTQERWRFSFSLLAPVISLFAWLVLTKSSLFENYGLNPLLSAGIALLAVVVASHGAFERLQKLFLPLAAVATGLYLGWTVLGSSDPIHKLTAQWENFGLGAGGWGATAWVFLLLVLLLGWRNQTSLYRWLLALSLILLAATFLSKTLDGVTIGGSGSFGRESFYDSLNRMMLHLLPLFSLTVALGLTKIIDQSAIFLTKSAKGVRHDGS